MKLIKLNAIDSTNSFLKDLAKNSVLENFTTVVAKNQIKGRGQQEGTWVSEKGKNLTLSTYVSFCSFDIQQKRYLNFAVTLAIYKTLQSYNLQNIYIKWPNDILSENKKIAGVLVENTFSSSKVKNTIIGIGLNVNQMSFFDLSTKATSLKKSLNTHVDIDLAEVLNILISELKIFLHKIEEKKFLEIEEAYLSKLYKKNVPTMFKDRKNVLFMGIIKGVAANGNLQIQLENDVIKEFGIKEVSFA